MPRTASALLADRFSAFALGVCCPWICFSLRSSSFLFFGASADAFAGAWSSDLGSGANDTENPVAPLRGTADATVRERFGRTCAKLYEIGRAATGNMAESSFWFLSAPIILDVSHCLA